MRRALLRGGIDLPAQDCAYCGKRMIFGIVYSAMIDEKKYRVCSFECEKALKEAKRDEDSVRA